MIPRRYSFDRKCDESVTTKADLYLPGKIRLYLRQAALKKNGWDITKTSRPVKVGCQELIADPHVLGVSRRPLPARTDAITPPSAVPETASMSTRENAAAMSTSEVATGTMPPKVGNVAAAMSTPMAATVTTAVSATASEGVSGKR